jgi:hypothetical protein
MMASIFRPRSRAGIIVLIVIGVAAVSAHADPVADFYHGKTLSLIIGTSSGNDYDFHARRGRRQGGELPRLHRAQ